MKLSHTMSSREQVLPICSALINGVLFFLFFLKSAPVRGQLEIVFLFSSKIGFIFSMCSKDLGGELGREGRGTLTEAPKPCV